MSLDFFFFLREGAKRAGKELKTPTFQAHFSPSGDPCSPFGPRFGLPRSHPGWKLPISKAACGGTKHVVGFQSLHSSSTIFSQQFIPTKWTQEPPQTQQNTFNLQRWEKKLFNINPIIGKKNVQVRCPCIRR